MAGNNLRAAISVSVTLALSFAFTGFLSSSYRRARERQGQDHFELGKALESNGNVQSAVEEYRKALLFLPDQPDFRLSLAVALVDAGKLDEAESHLQQLLESEPTDGQINLMMARVAERRKKIPEAIIYFQRAVYGYWPRTEIPTRHAARWELVELLEKQNRISEAIGELLQLYANAPNDPAERAKIGLLLLQFHATSDAENVLRQVVRDFPDKAEGHQALGQVYFDSRDYLGARHEFQRAVHLNPSDRPSVNQLAVVNSIIELDPTQMRLSSTQRLQKSRLVLDRVLHDLNECKAKDPAPGEKLDADLDSANKLLGTAVHDIDEATNQLQDTAVQLSKNYKSHCAVLAKDEALQNVLNRVVQ